MKKSTSDRKSCSDTEIRQHNVQQLPAYHCLTIRISIETDYQRAGTSMACRIINMQGQAWPAEGSTSMNN